MSIFYKIFVCFCFFIIKIFIYTYKISIINDNNEDILLKKNNKPIIYLTLHQKFIPVLAILIIKTPIVVMISNSIDGEIANRIVSVFGVDAVRGSSSKNGSKSLKKMASIMKEKDFSIGFTLDGPNGPIGVIKPGIIRIAQITGNSILPVAVSCNKFWIYNSWDRFIIPKPFSKIRFIITKEIKIKKKLSKKEFESKRVNLEYKIQQIYKKIQITNWM